MLNQEGKKMAKLSHFQLQETPLYLVVRERERESRDFLPDILRDLDFKPRHVVVEQKKLSVWGVSFSRTRISVSE